MEKEKKYLVPVAEVIEFTNDDIVTTSGEDEIGGVNYEDLL